MKLKQFQKDLIKNNIDGAFFLSKDPAFFYFSQVKIKDSYLFIPSKGAPLLLVSSLEKPNTKIKILFFKNLLKDIKDLFKKKNIKVLGINESVFTVKQNKLFSKFVKTKDVEAILSTLRLTKSSKEVSLIKNACTLTEKILKEIISDFTFKLEGDVKNYIKKRAFELGCKLSFEPIVASGKNASVPHYEGNAKLKKGFLVIDMGLKYKGYCADITRTFYLGKVSKKELEVYNGLLKIQEQAIKMVVSGRKISEIELFVRKSLGKEEKYFSHSLGHGLGLEVHELPVISSKNKEVLKEGMVITIEPGIYKNFGIRIEDDVLVTKKGPILLSNVSKNLIFPKV